ncbi:thiol reductant ABC exporter subunit CydC [Staphylococcus schleiferi]|uniref:ABC transporter ATP-binding protein n=1 Tax=Staphylococcus schleiferi TaxID=1295 RepID=A0A7Z7VYN9_STASC|nr:thiol reductant ABC exporter subunit CydC [Staphylococcus schleiferi]RTX78740.1 thiol reductant ABC exporter subunit CydC [Staphylococcus schleiferi subsp. schleiferi]CAD7360494.1 ABC transporter ATP-binding protein [Staphylococcus schleiferi]SUM90074.1 ABC transporter ATP-binding protein [Staphylococcus schleiferi]
MNQYNQKLNRTINIKWNKDILMAIFIGVVGSAVALGMFFLSGYMITQSALGAPLFALMGLIVTVKLFGFTRAITRYYERLRSHRATFTMLRDVRVQLYRALIPIVPDVFRKFRSSDLLGRMVTQVESLQNVYLRVYYPPIVIGITTLLTAGVLFYFSWTHAVLILFTMVLTLLVLPWLQAQQAKQVQTTVNQSQQQFMHEYHDRILGHNELRRFNSSEKYETKLSKSETHFNLAEHHSQLGHLKYAYVRNIISMVALLVSIILIIVMVEKQYVDVVYATSIILMILTLLEQAVPMSQVAYYKSETELAQQSLSEVMREQGSEKGHQNLNIADIENGEPMFNLTDVSLRYEHQQRPILSHLNLTIHQGEYVAIVGESGAGKSTLLYLLMGLYETTEGQITINQMPIGQLDTSHFHAQINTLLQQPHFFDGTVYDNLLTQASETECRKVLDQLQLAHIPLERPITMTKTALSGGEFQRLAIARMLLRRQPVWIVDEPTTALDIENSKLVMQQLHQQAQTLIVATHDMEYLKGFDRVIVMQEGKVVGDMSPESFLTQYVHHPIEL